MFKDAGTHNTYRLQYMRATGPNPHVVRMFLAEKKMLEHLPQVQVNILEGENRKPPYITKVNTRGQCPALKLPSGDVLCEILPICEYIEEQLAHAGVPVLIGATAEQRAAVRMWSRRVDLYLCEPMSAGFRFGAGRSVFQSRMRCPPEAAEGMRAIAMDGLDWIASEFARLQQLDGRQFLAGGDSGGVSMADILLYCYMNWGDNDRIGYAFDAERYPALAQWYAAMGQRESANV